MKEPAAVHRLFFRRRQWCDPGDGGLVVLGLQEFAMLRNANPRISQPAKQNTRLLIARFLGAGGAIGGLCSGLFGSHDDAFPRGACICRESNRANRALVPLQAKNKSVAWRADDRGVAIVSFSPASRRRYTADRSQRQLAGRADGRAIRPAPQLHASCPDPGWPADKALSTAPSLHCNNQTLTNDADSPMGLAVRSCTAAWSSSIARTWQRA